jgi:predicted HTH transcriptional regulator
MEGILYKRRKSEFKGISKRAKKLLAGDENLDVDFKEEMNGLKAVDLVAFANTEKGGAILIGIRDSKDLNGRQVGRIVGCHISDENKLAIISKAQSCTPPIHVDVFVENLNSKPFYRIEIPSGRNKPYCTGGGKYKIRGDGRNLPLNPRKLLAMFLEIESKKFFNQFQRVTEELEDNLKKTISEIIESISESKRSLDELRKMLRIEIDQDRDLKDVLASLRRIDDYANEEFVFHNPRSNYNDPTLQKEVEDLKSDIEKIKTTLKKLDNKSEN